MHLWNAILHPTDFTPVSEAAFEEAVRLAGASDAELIVLHVLAPPTPYELQGLGAGALVSLEAERRGLAENELRRLVRRAKERARGRARC